MKTETKTFLFSLLLHLLLVSASVLFAGTEMNRDTPVTIDFTVDNGRVQKEQGEAAKAAAPPARTKATQPRVVETVQTAKTVPSPQQPVSPVQPASSEPAAAVPVQQAALPRQQYAAVGETRVTGSNKPGPSGNATGGHPDGQGRQQTASRSGAGEEALRQQYLRKHFGYIRDLVASNLRYPGLARRMGWSGTLAVEFVVQKDGRADTIRIVRSSGVPVLDSDARDTVIRSAPFPKPPVSARLIIPVEYRLEN